MTEGVSLSADLIKAMISRMEQARAAYSGGGDQLDTFAESALDTLLGEASRQLRERTEV